MFDQKKFIKTKFIAREETVAVPELAEFFDGDPVWVVKGLTGEELYRVNQASDRDEAVAAAISAFYGPGSKENSYREMFGLTDTAPEEHTRRLEMLILGTVSPENLDRPTMAKIALLFPATVRILTDKIIGLTGAGYVPGKHSGSGQTDECGKP